MSQECNTRAAFARTQNQACDQLSYSNAWFCANTRSFHYWYFTKKMSCSRWGKMKLLSDSRSNGEVIKWQPWKYKHFSNHFLTAQIKFTEQKCLLLVHCGMKTEHNPIITGYFTSFGVPEVSWQEQKCRSSMSQRDLFPADFRFYFFLGWMPFQFLEQCNKGKKG